MNLYTTANLLQMIQEVDEPDVFLKSRYAPTNAATDVFNVEKILAEYRDADRRIAPFVTEYSNGATMSRIGERMREFEPPKISLNRPITLDDVKKRGFGEAIFPTMDPAQRAAALAIRDMDELQAMITRREEWMTAQVLLSNGCVCEAVNDDPGKPQKLEVRYYDGDVNPATFAPSTDWDDPAATIMDDLGQMIDDLESRGLAAEDFVCAPDVAHAITRNAEIREVLDNRRYEWGESRPRKLAPGASIVAVLNVDGFDINVISYGAKYVDGFGEGAEVKPYIPAGHGFLTAPNALKTMYGAVTQVEQSDGDFHTYGFPRVPKYEADSRNNVRLIEVSSRPLVIPNNVNPSISVQAIGN